MRKIGLALIGAVLLASASASADNTAAPAAAAPAAAPAKGGGPKYGPAGCGLGSLLFSPDSGFTQIFAATTNGTSANQTFAISSGTSNCDSGPTNSASAKVFIQANREALSKDIARGTGETISSLSQIAGCSDSSAVGASLQRRFRVIFPNATMTDQQVADNVVSSLRTDKTLSCHI